MKTSYIKCPRCDLNFIQKREKHCAVCKQEMQALATNYTEGADNMGLCPICKVNYITDEEKYCDTCVSETELSEEELDALYGGIPSEGLGEELLDDDEDDDDADDELEMLSLDLEEEEPEEEEIESADPLDDFEDIPDDELEDDDEEEEEEI